ncbi:conjugation system SOS inhibitor PsiB family protein [Winslowiella toletana]|uniref:conjugation system SOS inhibitor PsiB family protein n=1 Tax=Winslowiella toletana TaxID=92490 RepID=UPI0028BF46AB|nr:conjugation system SOS inhibitor PsiB family protein [Winslowiella toletana]WNN46716.1 conjugation system SOS inhibitor PsiB family protein [Winslowiella toletana]
MQLRFQPPGALFSLCVCSPGDVSGEWLIVFVSADGCCARKVLRLVPFDPLRISALFAAAGQASQLDYSASGMAEYLAEEVSV